MYRYSAYLYEGPQIRPRKRETIPSLETRITRILINFYFFFFKRHVWIMIVVWEIIKKRKSNIILRFRNLYYVLCEISCKRLPISFWRSSFSPFNSYFQLLLQWIRQFHTYSHGVRFKKRVNYRRKEVWRKGAVKGKLSYSFLLLVSSEKKKWWLSEGIKEERVREFSAVF